MRGQMTDIQEGVRKVRSGQLSQRRTRLNIVPGKSVAARRQSTSEEIDAENEEEREDEESNDENRGDESEEGEREENESKEESVMDDEVPVQVQTSFRFKKGTGIRPAAVKDLKIGDFVAVQFEGKIFLASTDSLNEGRVMVKFLKKIGGKACENKFVYPVQDDLSVIFDEELIGIVEQCAPDRRGSIWTAVTDIPFSSL